MILGSKISTGGLILNNVSSVGYLNRMPTVAQWNVVINNLKNVEDFGNESERFNMEDGRVSDGPGKCSSVFCIGGLYAMSQRHTDEISKAIEAGDCNYVHGADLMASHLGFRDNSHFRHWAVVNDNQWGNSLGDYMFSCVRAYNGLSEFSKFPVTIIIAHFRGVRDRCAEFEKGVLWTSSIVRTSMS